MIGAHEVGLGPMTALGLSPTEAVDLAADLGYDLVGVKIDGPPERLPFPLLSDAALVAQLRRRLDATGLHVLEADVLAVGPSGPPSYLDQAFEVSATLGARFLMVLGLDPDYDRLAAHVHQVCERAVAWDVSVALEVVHLTAVRTLLDARRLAALVDHPAFGFVVDALHTTRVGDGPDDVAETANLVAMVQACDATLEAPEDLFAEAVGGRQLPGEGALPLAALIERLAADVPISIEVPSERLWSELGHRALADRSLAGLREVLAPLLSQQSSRSVT
jgi:sugar phosphate isomerase/epimerase